MNAAQDLAQAAAVPAYRHQPPSLYVVPAFYDWLLAASDDLAQAWPPAVDSAGSRP